MTPTAVSSGRGELSGNGVAEQDRRTGKGEQRQRMAEPPGQPMLDDIADLAAPRRDRGDGGDMVGLQRMLHAQQEAETQNCEHASPATCPSDTSGSARRSKIWAGKSVTPASEKPARAAIPFVDCRGFAAKQAARAPT